MVKNPPANAGEAGDVGLIPHLEDPLEKEKSTHSSILAWKIPWTEELGGCSPWGHKESEQLTLSHFGACDVLARLRLCLALLGSLCFLETSRCWSEGRV